jgi:PAS domain S-box-containing protein
VSIQPPIVVPGPAGQPPPWAARLGVAPLVVSAPPLPDSLRDQTPEAPCALLDGTHPAAVRLARRVHELDPPLQLVIVAPAAEHARLHREVILAPGAGEIWIVEPAEVDPELVQRAASVTRQRRQYRSTRNRLQHDLTAIEPNATRRAVVSDAYLAALLSVLPNPVLSIDEGGTVLSWSAAAEQVLGRPRADALGAPLSRVLAVVPPSDLDRLLADPGTSPRGELRFRRDAGDLGTALVSVVPVEAAGHRVRAVFLQDVTEERRIQAEREAQAEELQNQAAQLEEAQVELEMANDELQRTNAALAVRTREAEQARSAAEHSRREAETANLAKSQFLATMSHEIRTPINAIIGYTDLLEMGISGPVTEGQRAQHARVRASSEHLLGLINDVLDLAKVEAGHMLVERDRLRVADSVAAAVSLVEPQAAQRRLALEVHCGSAPGPAYIGDADRVRQILANLLSNAIKFTEPGGRVSIACGNAPGPDAPPAAPAGGPWSWVAVTDTGIGIPAEQLQRVFRPFEQAERGHTRTRGGTGLGLSISRELALLMGGDLTVESEPGRGSTFTLWLPSDDVAALPALAGGAAGAGPAHRAVGLYEAGSALLSSTAEVVERFAERLVHDPRVPMAAGLDPSAVRDHTVTLVADMAQTLLTLSGAGEAQERELRDGSEIQRLIADLHGAQRARLGWSETALVREFEILREEIQNAVRRSGLEAATVEGALATLARFVDRVERISILSWRAAVAPRPPDAGPTGQRP